MAPKDCDCFYVLSPVPNLKSKINWDIEGKEYKDRILKALEKTLLPNLSKYLDVVLYDARRFQYRLFILQRFWFFNITNFQTINGLGLTINLRTIKIYIL